MLNEVRLLGNLGQDPDLRYTKGGTPVATLSVATNRRWTDGNGEKQEETTWHRVVVWNQTAENCAKYLKKGRQVLVLGRLRNGQYEKDGEPRYYTEVVANSVIFVGGQKGDGRPHPAEAEDQDHAPDGWEPPSPGDDDIPF